MYALYRSSCSYLLAEQKVLGETKLASQESRMKHFIESLSSMPQNVDDSMTVQLELANDTAAFTPDHRKQMAAAVAAHMANGASPSTATSLQTHLYLHNYNTEPMWAVLKGDKTWNDKVELYLDYLIQTVGLRNPNDGTVKCILAVLQLCHPSRVFSPTDSYLEINRIKSIIQNKRAIIPGKQLMSVYPQDVEEFRKLHTSAFLQCEPPVASQVQEIAIRQKTRKDSMPTRRTNKFVESKTSQPAASSSSNPFQDAMQQMALQFIMQGGRMPIMNSPSPPPKTPKRPLALMDAPADAEEEEDDAGDAEPAPKKPSPQKLDVILKLAQDTIGANTINRRKKNTADDAEEDEHDEDDENDKRQIDDRKSAKSKIDNRKSKIAKKPAAAILMKKPSSATPAEKPAPSFEPSVYRSGRIYFAKTQNRFRIYCRPGDKHEKSVKYDKANGNNRLLKEAWAKALAFIDDDPRPF